MTLPRAIGVGEYYHLFSRGAHRHAICSSSADYARLMFALLYFQSPLTFPKVSRMARTYATETGFEVPNEDIVQVISGRTIELVAFCVMGNHFHLLARELVEGGISAYMQRVLTSHTKYFHTIHEAAGHVFQGSYQSVHVESNEQLMHLSAYIHRNPRELKAWKGREDGYPWSSYRDYVHENRWGGLLAQEIILDQFEGTSASNYADYVKTSPAKEAGLEV